MRRPLRWVHFRRRFQFTGWVRFTRRLPPISSGIVEELIGRLRCEHTILVVTHNLGQARRLADYAAMFWVKDGSGRLIEEGTASQVFESPGEDITAAYVNGGIG